MTDKQTILITGATGNVGGGAAVALAKRGARVVLLGRKLETLAARADSIRAVLSEAQPRVRGQVDDPHGAAAELREHLIRAELRAWSKCQQFPSGPRGSRAIIWRDLLREVPDLQKHVIFGQ